MIQNIYKSLIIPLRDFICPPICFTCGKMLSNSDLKICEDCWNSFIPLNPDHPLLQEKKKALEEYICDIVCGYLFEKENKIQEAIHLFKYQNVKSLAIRFGEEIGKLICQQPNFPKADYLLPVPLHKAKLRERGYNQSDYICKGILHITSIPVCSDLLRRTKYTKTQAMLSMEERKENVSDAFKINLKHQQTLQGKTVILVDDVITTGSTISACAKELKSNGVERVLAVSVALA